MADTAVSGSHGRGTPRADRFGTLKEQRKGVF
jgi:hypothetical protein